MDDPLFRRIRLHAQKRLTSDMALDRKDRLPKYKRFLELEDEMLRRYHEKGDSGIRVTQARSVMMDVMVENLFEDAVKIFQERHGKLPCRVSVVATGGYGRGELSPFSDIDLLFVYPNRANSPQDHKLKEIISEEVLYILWDLRLKVGHATRNTREAIQESRREIKTKNAILDARLIAGSKGLFHDFQSHFRRFVLHDEPEEYIRQRLLDLEDRYDKYGNTPFLQEPEIKNGVGGLRDYQNILWMSQIRLNTQNLSSLLKRKYLIAPEDRQLTEGYTFLLRVRNELHFQSKRPTDLLNLESQPIVAEALGYPQKNIFRRVEAFMRDFYNHTWNIYRILERVSRRMRQKLLPGSQRISFGAVLQGYQKNPIKEFDGLVLRDSYFHPAHARIFIEDPDRFIRVFRHAQQFQVDLSLELSDLLETSLNHLTDKVSQSPAANRAFRSILQSPGEVYPILWEMHKLGVLGKFIPEFGLLTCRVQHEYYHRYTADIHILNTIKQLDAVFRAESPEDQKYREALRETENPTLLYLILLLHDIGKAQGVKGHAERGTAIAKPMLARMEVKEDFGDKILFIIQQHLEMARFWQRFDIDDPRTAQRFGEVVDEADKLRFLYVHTYCDARGTSTSVWNSYKDALHTNLYRRTLELLTEGKPKESETQEQIMGVYEEIKKRSLEDITQEEVEAHFSLLPERYFLHHNADDVELHLRMVHQLLTTIYEADSLGSLVPVIDWQDDLEQSLTTVNVVTWDRPGLFYKLAGALSASGVNILSTKAISRKDHITIDTFYVVEPGGGVVSNQKTKDLFEHYVEQTLLHNKDLMPELRDRAEKERRRRRSAMEKMKAQLPNQVDVYHELSLKRTILEVQSQDEIGLLYQVSRAIFESGFDITFARIATERGVAMDTFYIEPINAEAGKETENLVKLRESINRIIGSEEKNSSAATG